MNCKCRSCGVEFDWVIGSNKLYCKDCSKPIVEWMRNRETFHTKDFERAPKGTCAACHLPKEQFAHIRAPKGSRILCNKCMHIFYLERNIRERALCIIETEPKPRKRIIIGSGMGLSETAKTAREMGLSYGEYMARYGR